MEVFSGVYQSLVDNFVVHIAIVMATVAFVKELFQLEGNSVRWVSFVTGIFISGVYYVGYLLPGVAQYVEGGLFILTMGLVASGFYDLAVSVRKVE